MLNQHGQVSAQVTRGACLKTVEFGRPLIDLLIYWSSVNKRSMFENSGIWTSIDQPLCQYPTLVGTEGAKE